MFLRSEVPSPSPPPVLKQLVSLNIRAMELDFLAYFALLSFPSSWVRVLSKRFWVWNTSSFMTQKLWNAHPFLFANQVRSLNHLFREEVIALFSLHLRHDMWRLYNKQELQLTGVNSFLNFILVDLQESLPVDTWPLNYYHILRVFTSDNRFYGHSFLPQLGTSMSVDDDTSRKQIAHFVLWFFFPTLMHLLQWC